MEAYHLIENKTLFFVSVSIIFVVCVAMINVSDVGLKKKERILFIASGFDAFSAFHKVKCNVLHFTG